MSSSSSEQPARRSMIYHVPYGLNPAATSASGIRPVRMRRAFADIGFEVLEVSGSARERRRQMANIRSLLRSGVRPEFVYSEAATIPNALTEKHHLPTHPRMDLRFLRWCRKSGLRVGVYYRDVYWRFPEYVAAVGRVLSWGTKIFYRDDLRGYRTAVDHIYLQSDRMATYLPRRNQEQVRTLPPGGELVDADAPDLSQVSLLYVGGLGGPYYGMEEVLRGVSRAKSASLTLCTRESEWQAVQGTYEPLLASRTEVVHRSGQELEALYDQAHLGVLLMEPVTYRDFVLPFKLFEYLGHGKPVVVTAGTLVGEFVAEHGIGWAIPYDSTSLGELLDRLVANPRELEEMQSRVLEVRKQHTWQARALQVAQDLARTEGGN